MKLRSAKIKLLIEKRNVYLVLEILLYIIFIKISKFYKEHYLD